MPTRVVGLCRRPGQRSTPVLGAAQVWVGSSGDVDAGSDGRAGGTGGATLGYAGAAGATSTGGSGVAAGGDGWAPGWGGGGGA